MVNYNQIFLEKTGQDETTSPWDDTRIQGWLDNYSYILSREYATPWADFDSVPDVYQYPVTLYGAIQFWWAKAGEYASKFDMSVGGGGTNQKSTQLFYRALEMIDYLTKELETVAKDLMATDEGDIIVGQIVKRSKFTGYLVPRADDAAGDWTS
jgi:hypothetical protein